MSPGGHVSALNSMGNVDMSPGRMNLRDVTRKTLASPKMSKVRPLSPYMNREAVLPASGQQLMKYAIAKKDPTELLK